MIGWIKLHRKFLEWEWYTDQNVKDVFIHCLLLANIEDKVWRGIEIKRGSFISSVGKISTDTGISIKAVRIALDKLKGTNEIITKGASKWTRLTVCNYETYQDEDELEGRAKGKRKGKQRANKGQQLKNDKNDKNIDSVPESPLPETEKAVPVFTKIRNDFEKFFEENKKEKYYFTASDAKHTKQIVGKLSFRLANKKPPVECTDENILKSFNSLLAMLPKWHMENLSLTNINSKFNEIIASLTKVSNPKKNSDVGTIGY